MKKTILIAVLTAAIVGPAQPVIAGPSVYATRQNGYYSGVGGEFTLTPAGVPGLVDGQSFQTFCLEYNEYIWLNRTYDVVVNTSAVRGGEGADGDPLDARTAFLYDAFLDGDLSSYGYDYTSGPGRSASAGALQEVIWFLEDERAKTWMDGDGSLQDKLYQAAEQTGWQDIGDIRVLNLYECGRHRQDQLTHIVVPVPGALTLAVLGAVFVGWVRKVRTNSHS